MGANPRTKGAAGEREAAAAWSDLTGAPWQRGLLQSRWPEIPDIWCRSYPELWVEVKRQKRPNLWAALEQATNDSRMHGSGVIPLVTMRRDRGPWVVAYELRHMRRVAEALGWADRLVL